MKEDVNLKSMSDEKRRRWLIGEVVDMVLNRGTDQLTIEETLEDFLLNIYNIQIDV